MKPNLKQTEKEEIGDVVLVNVPYHSYLKKFSGICRMLWNLDIAMETFKLLDYDLSGKADEDTYPRG